MTSTLKFYNENSKINWCRNYSNTCDIQTSHNLFSERRVIRKKNEENRVDTTELDQHHVCLQGDGKALDKDRDRKSIRVNAVCITCLF